MEDLQVPLSVRKPGPKVWGLCATEDQQLIYTDIKQKQVWKLHEHGNSMIVRKVSDLINSVMIG